MGWNGINSCKCKKTQKTTMLWSFIWSLGLAVIVCFIYLFHQFSIQLTNAYNLRENVICSDEKSYTVVASDNQKEFVVKTFAENSAIEQDEWNLCPLYPNEKLVSSVTNRSSGYIVDNTLMKNGKKAQHVRELPSIWSTTTDGLIAGLLFNSATHADMPPLPHMSTLAADREFLKSLNTPIEISTDDTEDIKAIKLIVRAARQDIKDRMEAGEHFNDILTEHQTILNDNGAIRRDAINGLLEVRRNGSDSDISIYVTAINKHLESLGISPIGTIRERYHTEDKR